MTSPDHSDGETNTGIPSGTALSIRSIDNYTEVPDQSMQGQPTGLVTGSREEITVNEDTMLEDEEGDTTEEDEDEDEEDEDDVDEEDEDEDEDEEPTLKYERISGVIPDLFKKDSAASLATFDNKMVP
jgi:hypothetical protein